MMKYTLFPLILLVLFVSACAQTHYTRLQGDEVVFYYRAPKAHEVLFASSMDNYKLHPTRKIRENLWALSVPAGKGFAYFYVVDGVATLPECPFTENDDFGSWNCLYIAEM
jgi:hypothetical protein